jgi:peptidyl-prolyl cis-trans isomerase D
MFETIRKHNKWLMGLLFVLIIPSFVLFGVDSYTRMRENSPAVAKVGGTEVTQADWDNAHKQEVERFRNSSPNADVKLLDAPEVKYAILERLVQEKVLAMAVEKTRLQASDARLARELEQDPAIQSLRTPAGKLDMDRYKQLAASQGLTPEGFEAKVRSQISERQVLMGLGTSALTSTALPEVSLQALLGRREIQFQVFGPAAHASKLVPTDADLQAYHQENQAQFKAPESASVEYVVLDLEAIKKGITLNEADVKTYYEQNAARLSGPEERRASHILITAAKDLPAADKAKAKAKADELLAEVKKAPKSFADLARKHSQDPGSAAKGGDLDFFGRGAMVKPFEDAAFALKSGEISAVVESDFGYHIIQVTDIKEPKKKSFDEMRASIESDLKLQQARQKYAEQAEQFTNTVYEQSDSLKPVAEKLKLSIRAASGLARTPNPTTPKELANAKLLSAVFGTDAIEKKRNTEAVETAPNQLVSARIVAYSPARTLPLAEVKQQVQQAWVAKRAAELARKEGQDKLAAWKATAPTGALPSTATVSRDAPGSVPPALLEAVLKVPAGGLPSWVGVDLGMHGYAVAKVTAAMDRNKPDAAMASQEQLQFAAGLAQAEAMAYYNSLKARFKVQFLVPKPARAEGKAATAQG